MSHSPTSNNSGEYDPITYVPEAENHGTSALWKTFILLSVVTILDIILYFIIPPSMARNITFILLGIFKAGFIVYVFMHLTYERGALKYSIVLPMIFVLYLIMLILIEADFWNRVMHVIYG